MDRRGENGGKGRDRKGKDRKWNLEGKWKGEEREGNKRENEGKGKERKG